MQVDLPSCLFSWCRPSSLDRPTLNKTKKKSKLGMILYSWQKAIKLSRWMWEFDTSCVNLMPTKLRKDEINSCRGNQTPYFKAQRGTTIHSPFGRQYILSDSFGARSLYSAGILNCRRISVICWVYILDLVFMWVKAFEDE